MDAQRRVPAIAGQRDRLAAAAAGSVWTAPGRRRERSVPSGS